MMLADKVDLAPADQGTASSDKLNDKGEQVTRMVQRRSKDYLATVPHLCDHGDEAVTTVSLPTCDPDLRPEHPHQPALLGKKAKKEQGNSKDEEAESQEEGKQAATKTRSTAERCEVNLPRITTGSAVHQNTTKNENLEMLQQGEWELSNSNSHSRLRSEGVGMPACVQSAVKRQREEDLDQMETFAKQVAEKCSQIQAISVQETSTLTQMLTTTAQQMDELDQTKAIKKQGVDKLDQMQLPERHRAEEESDHTETVVSQKVDNSEQAWTTSQFKHSLISEGASTDAKCEMDDQLTAEDNKPTESAVKPSLLSPPSSGEAMPDHMTRSTSVGKVEGTRRKAIPNKKSTKKPRPPKRIRDRLKRIAEGMLDDSLPPPEQSSFGDMLSGSGQTELKEETRPLEQREAVTNGDTQSGLESPGGSSTTTTSSHPPTRKQKSAGLLPLGGLVPTYHHGLYPILRPQRLSRRPRFRSSDSSISGGHSPPEPSLRKLVKDLHRCDVSLMRYQQSLNEQCDQAIHSLKRVFTTIRIGLNTREEDIFRDIQSVRQTAAFILQRRKITALSLRRLIESASQLEEPQKQELKQQLKLFIADRRVDEEIGTMYRFFADPDELLPHVMNFGRVPAVQLFYNSWNENPREAVDKKAIKVHLPDQTLGPTEPQPQPSKCQEETAIHPDVPQQTPPSLSPVPEVKERVSTPVPESHASLVQSPSRSPEPSPPSLPPSPSRSPEPSPPLLPPSPSPSPRCSPLPSLPPSPSTTALSGLLEDTQEEVAVSKVADSKVGSEEPVGTTYLDGEGDKESNLAHDSQEELHEEDKGEGEEMDAEGEATPEYEDDEFGRRKKYTPQELAAIQARVRESLEQQGVFLYDPFTGKVNRPPHLDPNRKKKTATQLRRERKKRQLERERRQRGSSERAEKSQESRKPSIASSMHDDSGIATSESASGQEESLQKKPHPEEPPTSSSTSSSSTPKPTHHKKIKPVVIIHKHSSQHNRTSTAAHSPCEHITKKGGVASGGAADPETGQKLPPLKDKERNGRPKKHKSSENPDTSRNGTQEDLLPASKANLKATPMGNAHKLSQKIGPGIKLLKKPSFRSKLINSAINFPKCPPPSPSSPITSSPASKKTPTTTANHSKK